MNPQPNKSQLIALIALLCILATPGYAQSKDTEPGYYVFPAAARLSGIGVIYGVGFYLENIASSAIDIGGGKTMGRVDGTGAVITDIGFFDDNISITAGYLQLNKLYLDISYTRGMADDKPVTQQGNAQGQAFSFDWKMFEPIVTLNTTLISWSFSFDDYLTHGDEKTIELPNLHLGDLNSTFVINSLALNFVDDEAAPRSGVKVGLSNTQFSTGTEFSSTSTFSYFANGYLPIGDQFSFVVRLFGSDASVTSEKTTDIDKIKSILSIDCTQVTDADKQAECTELEDNLANYIASHNKYGTAAPLGGNGMLRSYREGRYRGAHTRFLGSELRYDIPFDTFLTNLQTALFYEQGSSADEASKLSDDTKTSYGAALRFSIDDLVIRLESANGDEGSEWFLTFGRPW